MNPKFAKSHVGSLNSGLSEEIFPDLLQTQISKYNEFMGNADTYVPETILERPRKRLYESE